MSDAVVSFQKALPGRQSASTARLATWWLSYSADRKHVSLSLLCPVCERPSTLRYDGTGHLIHADGTFTPSIVCKHMRNDGTPCNFHVMGKLEGWESVDGL